MAGSAPKILQLLQKLGDRPHKDEAVATDECPLCFESYRDTLRKVLPCGHTVCGPCLQRLANSNSLQCPMDKDSAQLPEDGVDGLPANDSLKEWLSNSDSNRSRPTTTEPSECEECHGTTAIQLCNHCQQTICLECQKLHADENRAQLRRLAKQLRNTQVATEKELARKLSMVTAHKNQFDNAKAKAAKFGDDLLKKVSLFVQSQKELVYTRIDDAAREYEEFVSIYVDQEDENSKHRNVCREFLEKLCTNNRLVLFSDTELAEFEADLADFLSSAQSSVDTFRPSGPKCDFLIPGEDAQDNVCQQLSSLFHVTDISGYTTLQTDGINADAETDAAYSQTDLPASRTEEQLEQANNMVVKEEKIEAIASISNSTVTIGESLFDNTPTREAMRGLDERTPVEKLPPRNGGGAYKFRWKVLGAHSAGKAGYLKDPYATEISPATGDIFVADGRAGNIEVFKRDGTPTGPIGANGTMKADMTCMVSVAWAHPDRIYVTDSKGHRVQVIDLTSRIITSLGQKGTEDGAFNKPYDIAIDRTNGDVFVCDQNTNRVQVFVHNGAFKYSFGSKGQGKLFKPTGIAVSKNTVYVAHLRKENHAIQVYSTRGDYSQSIQDDRMMFIYGIAVDSDHTNMYACCEGRIAVFKTGRPTSMERIIDCPVAGERPYWITLLSSTEGLVSVRNCHQLFRICLK